jgi:hypothetical protein
MDARKNPPVRVMSSARDARKDPPVQAMRRQGTQERILQYRQRDGKGRKKEFSIIQNKKRNDTSKSNSIL